MNEIIIYVLKVIAIHGLLYFFYRLVFRNSGHHVFNRGYLLLAIISAFIIPLLEISLPEKVQSAEEISAIMWFSEPAMGMEEFELVPVQQQSSNSYWYLVPWLYGVVVLALLGRSIFYLIVLARLQRHSEYVKKRWFKLFKISHDRPFSFFSNVFMPKSLFGSDAFEQILAHECEHVRQLHSIDRLLTDFVVSLFWFNPFIYLYRNALIEIHEFQADEVVLNRFNDPVGYQEILFSQLQTAQYTGLVSHFNFSMIKKRIVMMNKQRKMSGWVYALTAPVTLMVVFAFSSKEAMEPINEVGGEIAAIIGPENGIEWSQLKLTNSINETLDVSDDNEVQDNAPSISPVRSKDLVRLSSGFGMRTHPIHKTKKMHLGIDFSCPTGTEILATASGEVVGIRFDEGGYGKIITIKHDDKYQTRYAQLSEFKVEKGDKVQKGDVIALSGSSGMSTAPHLHYEILKEGKQVDPVEYIKDYDFKASKSQGSFKKQQERLHEQERELALREQELAQQEMLLAKKVEEVSQLEQMKAEEIRLAAAYKEESSQQTRLEADEKRLMEMRILNEKIQLEDSKQNRIVRFDGEKESPLFVIDGVEVKEVSGLDPNDITSVQVLKGKSAKDKYGKKGQHGVIEIKTKVKQKEKAKGKSKSKNKEKGSQTPSREEVIDTQRKLAALGYLETEKVEAKKN